MATSVDTRETTSLISSDKVDGTAVYGSDEQKIGSIEHLMIDKISGKSRLRGADLWRVHELW